MRRRKKAQLWWWRMNTTGRYSEKKVDLRTIWSVMLNIQTCGGNHRHVVCDKHRGSKVLGFAHSVSFPALVAVAGKWNIDDAEGQLLDFSYSSDPLERCFSTLVWICHFTDHTILVSPLKSKYPHPNAVKIKWVPPFFYACFAIPLLLRWLLL